MSFLCLQVVPSGVTLQKERVDEKRGLLGPIPGWGPALVSLNCTGQMRDSQTGSPRALGFHSVCLGQQQEGEVRPGHELPLPLAPGAPGVLGDTCVAHTQAPSGKAGWGKHSQEATPVQRRVPCPPPQTSGRGSTCGHRPAGTRWHHPAGRLWEPGVWTGWPALQGARWGSEPLLRAECAVCAQSAAVGRGRSRDSSPIVRTWLPAAVPGLSGCGRRHSPSPGSCLASQDGHPGGLAQHHVSRGPGSGARLGGQGLARAAGRRSRTRPLPQLCPLYLRHSAAAPLHSLDGPSFLPPHRGAGLGRQLGRPAREAGSFSRALGPSSGFPAPYAAHLEGDTPGPGHSFPHAWGPPAAANRGAHGPQRAGGGGGGVCS